MASLDASFVMEETRGPDQYRTIISLHTSGDGKVLVGSQPSGDDILLCRLTPDGSQDTSFTAGLTGYELAQVVVPSDGKIYVAGAFRNWWDYELLLLNADGSSSSGFVVDFTGGLTALAVQSDDRVVVNGLMAVRAGNGVDRQRKSRWRRRPWRARRADPAMNIPRFFADRPVFAAVLSVVITLMGTLAYFQLPDSALQAIEAAATEAKGNFAKAPPAKATKATRADAYKLAH